MTTTPSSYSTTLPAALQSALDAALATQETERVANRIFAANDPTIWTGGDETNWLGWLEVTGAHRPDVAALQGLAGELRAAGYTDAVLLGMGGSSLGPDVLARTFGPQEAGLRLRVLDSTVPSQVRRVLASSPVASTAYIVASKSGSTLEPAIMLEYAWAQAVEAVGEEAAGQHFVGSPGTELEFAL